ncbi:MAG: glycosyltransferase family 9 protein [Candidatus Omnitrophota bacterium]|jgi:heptosyltransferase-2|nr:glycosyltransferase family 9 protein [Candidatus Omnitrophota bacterium]
MKKRVLIINPFGIGDVLFSTPLVSAIRRRYQDSYIGYICNIRTKEILETNPDISELFVFERDTYRRLWKESKIKAIKKFFSFWREIQKRKFQTLFDLSLGKDYAFFCLVAGIKERRGFDYKRRGFFLTHKYRFSGFNDKPVAEYYMDLVLSTEFAQGTNIKNKTVLAFTDKDKKYIVDFLSKSSVSESDSLIGIAPGGGASFGKDKSSYRRWNWQNFGELAHRLSEKGKKIVLLWGPGEERLVEDIKKSVKEDILVSPKSTVREMAALMKRCDLVICNDGGVLHVAVSQDIPTISIFGPVDDKVYGPYPPSTRHTVIKNNAPCSPCYQRFKLPDCKSKECIDNISVDRVFSSAVSKVMEE